MIKIRANTRESIMPIGPNGQKRPADAIGSVVMAARIATAEIKDTTKAKSNKTKSRLAGSKARVLKLSPEARTEIAIKAASARWG